MEVKYKTTLEQSNHLLGWLIVKSVEYNDLEDVVTARHADHHLDQH